MARCCSVIAACASGLSARRQRRRRERARPEVVRAEPIDRPVPRNAHQPRNGRPEICVERLRARPHLDEDILQYLLRCAAVLQNPQDQPVQQAAMAIVQLAKRLGLARDDTFHEPYVVTRLVHLVNGGVRERVSADTIAQPRIDARRGAGGARGDDLTQSRRKAEVRGGSLCFNPTQSAQRSQSCPFGCRRVGLRSRPTVRGASPAETKPASNGTGLCFPRNSPHARRLRRPVDGCSHTAGSLLRVLRVLCVDFVQRRHRPDAR